MLNGYEPGEIERNEMLLTQPEVDVSSDEIDDRFSSSCSNKEFVKREASGKLAEDIRKRFGAPADAKVFLSEIAATVQIGDETWTHFNELLIECDGHTMEFESHEFTNSFMQMLEFLKETSD